VRLGQQIRLGEGVRADLVLDHCDQRLLPGRLAAGPLHAYAETDQVGRASVALHESAHSRVEGCAEAGHILGAEACPGVWLPGRLRSVAAVAACAACTTAGVRGRDQPAPGACRLAVRAG